MLLTYERRFRIRHYECDANGHVNHANYLRYMQEAAYEASAASGYDMVGYAALGRLWFIRETKIEYLRPMFYGENVIVRTWVEDFRRVRSIRAYEFRLADTEAISARGWSDWVYLDPASGKPRSIPIEVTKAFMPDANGHFSQPRQRFPTAPAMPVGTFHTLRSVEWRDLDAIQHMNNAVYLSYFEECALQANGTCGWPHERLKRENIGMIPNLAHIEYRQPAVLGDLLKIDTWLSHAQPFSFSRHFIVKRVSDHQIICQAHLDYNWVNLETRKAMRISPQYRHDLGPQISEASDD